MSEPTTMYRASVYFGSLSLWHPDTPVNVLFSTMQLSACGRYVQRTQQKLDRQGWETIQEDVNEYWQPTEEGAAAAIAPRLRQIGYRLILQAEELEEAQSRSALTDSGCA